MKILIVAFYDDNFGDMILRTCFTQLLQVALKNLEFTDYSLDYMPVTSVDEQCVASADLIMFPGGAMFGRTYEAFAHPIEQVTDIAERDNIPVVFSSIGLYETEENAASLRAIMQKDCLRAVSVREKPEMFSGYGAEVVREVRHVCDPAVWAGLVYADEIAAVRQNKDSDRRVVGINVVRGGLFNTYNVDWKLADEEAYLYELSQCLDEIEIDYRFFTNGQTIDNNALRHFADKYHLPDEKIVYVDTSRELVQTVAMFDAVAAVRMHASIISYALGVPSVNFVWNSKIPDFYDMIGCPERAITSQDWSAERVARQLREMLADEDHRPDPELGMTLYRFLFDTLSGLIPHDETVRQYDYLTVCEELCHMRVSEREDDTDLRVKVRRGEIRYFGLFTSDLSRKAEMRALKAELKKVNTEKKHLAAEKKKLTDEKKDLNTKLEKSEKQRVELQKQLDRVNSMFAVRAYRKMRRILSGIKRRISGS